MTDFTSLVNQARRRRLQQWGVNARRTDELNGHCHENAVFLARFLRCRGHDVEIACGGIINNPDDPPGTLKQARQDGAVHFWVIADGRHLDMASEPDNSIYADDAMPENYRLYHRLPAGLTADDLLPSNLDKHLNDRTAVSDCDETAGLSP